MDTSWLSALNDPGYVWDWKNPSATDEEIEDLVRYFGRPLPDDYVAFLRLSNGAGLWYSDLWYMNVLRSTEISTWATGYGFTVDNMPGAMIFGSSMGGEGLVFDIRPHHPDGLYPIIAANFVTIGWDEIIPVAPNFKSLLLLRRELLNYSGEGEAR